MPRRIHNHVAKMSKKLVNIRVSMLDADLDFPVQVVCCSLQYASFWFSCSASMLLFLYKF